NPAIGVLDIQSGQTTVRGLVIMQGQSTHRDYFIGVFLERGDGNLLEGNFIGVDPTGTSSTIGGLGVTEDQCRLYRFLWVSSTPLSHSLIPRGGPSCPPRSWSARKRLSPSSSPSPSTAPCSTSRSTSKTSSTPPGCWPPRRPSNASI